MCNAHITKEIHATAVATNSESCNGAVRQMVQVQKFFLPHHNNLLLEGNKCVHSVSEDGLKEPDTSKHSRQIFGGGREVSVTNHRRKCCAQTQVKVKRLR